MSQYLDISDLDDEEKLLLQHTVSVLRGKRHAKD